MSVEKDADERTKGVKDVGPETPDWQERFVRENADKFGQAGGKPVVQRGPGQSGGGMPEGEAFEETKDDHPPKQ